MERRADFVKIPCIDRCCKFAFCDQEKSTDDVISYDQWRSAVGVILNTDLNPV